MSLCAAKQAQFVDGTRPAAKPINRICAASLARSSCSLVVQNGGSRALQRGDRR
jgi:hypothetical protein